ncbi:MAG: HDOD domain-containing protein [Acidimicrobiales bacterium]
MTAPAVSATLATSVENLLEAMDRLPSQGNVALRVLWMADDPMTSLADLARAVQADPVLVARLLHLANSAFYSPRTAIGTVDRAITLLGFATVRTMATVVACGLGSGAAVPQGFWQHASATANAAQLIAWRFGIPAGDAFTVGLLHDLGRGLLHVADPVQSAEIDLALQREDEHEELGRLHPDPGHDPERPHELHEQPGWSNGALSHPVPVGGVDRLALERQHFGITHAEAAARVMGSWRFPTAMIEAVARHHELPTGGPSATTDLTRLLMSAEAVAERAFGPWGEPIERRAGIELLAIEPERLDAVVQRVRAESGTLAAVLER